MDTTRSSMDSWVLTPEQVAEVLCISKSTAYRLIEDGEIPTVRIGRLRRIRKADLECWMDDHMDDHASTQRE